MAIYTTDNNVTLLTGATDAEGDTMTVYSINSTVIDWTANSGTETINLTVGDLLVTEAGVCTFDTAGDEASLPASGATLANGSIDFRLTDGADTSSVYTETITLLGDGGADVAPTNITSNPAVISAADTTTTGSTLATISSNGTSPVLSLTDDDGGRFSLSGNLLQLDTALDYDTATSHSVTVQSTNSEGTITQSFTVSVTDGSVASPVGVNYDPLYDSGVTSGDIYVDPVNGSDTDNGTSLATAKQSLGAAVAAASEGDTIVMRGGSYRESVGLDKFVGASSETTFVRYGMEQPVVTGAETIAGWTQCTSGDQTELGGGYANIYKTTLSTSSFASSTPLGLNLRENGEFMSIATDRADTSELFFGRNKYTFHQGSFNLNGSGEVQSIDHSAVFGSYTSAQMLNAKVFVYRDPNDTTLCDITAFGSNVATINPNPVQNKFASQGNSSAQHLYSLVNILPAMAIGQWGYIDNGNGTLTLYCRPTNTANLTAGMTYSARTYGVNIQRGQKLKFEGISFEQYGGDGNVQSVALGGISSTSTTKTGITLKQCFFGKVTNGSNGYGAVYLPFTNDVLIEDCKFAECSNAYGYFLNKGNNVRIRNIESTLTGDSPVRHYGMTDYRMEYCYLHNAGKDAHANAWNIYGNASSGGSDTCLVFGCVFEELGGYVTWQGTTRIDFGMCQFGANTAPIDRRAVKDQNGSNYPVTASGEVCHFWNCFFELDPAELASTTNALGLGQSSVDVRYALYNCVIGGGGIEAPYLSSGAATIDHDRQYNVYVKPSFWQTNAAYGWSETATETVVSSYTTEFNDVANGDFTLISGNSIDSHGTYNMTSLIAGELATRYPGFNFNRDIDGTAYTPSSAKMGPFQTSWNSQVR